MIYRCRQFECEGTEREVDVEDSDFAPDVYAKKYIQFSDAGDVTFVEAFIDGEWVPWDVEVLACGSGVLALKTHRTTPEKVREEMRRAREQAS